MGDGIPLGSRRYHFSKKIFQRGIFEHAVGQQLLEPDVFVLERLQSSGLADVHAAPYLAFHL